MEGKTKKKSIVTSLPLEEYTMVREVANFEKRNMSQLAAFALMQYVRQYAKPEERGGGE